MIDAKYRERWQLFINDPRIAFQGPFRFEALHPATVRVYTQWWRWFEAWCRARGLRALPATSATVLRFANSCLTEGHPARAGEQGVCVSVSTTALAVTAITHVHRFLGYANVAAETRVYLKQMPPPSRSLAVTDYQDLQRILAQSATTRLQIRSRCVLTLLYAAHLSVPELVSLRREDYLPGRRNRLPALRVRSVAPDHAEHWQPLPRAVGKIIDAWIEAGEVRQGPLICDVRNAYLGQGRAVTAARIHGILRHVGPGYTAIGVQALHRGLAADITTRGRRNELTGDVPGLEQRFRVAGKKAFKYVPRDPLPTLRAFWRKQGRL